MTPTLHGLLRSTLALGGSDLHIGVESPPQVRVDGELQRLDGAALTASDAREICCGVLTDAQRRRFDEALELDFSLAVDGLGRVRGNLFRQRGAVGGVFRLIPGRVPSLQELDLPPVLSALAGRPRGLVLVTGPTGSGKSTTLAAMIDAINRERRGHILTIEDPIEFVHPHRSCLVTQREIHADTQGFSQALRAALREDPDVVLVGEMRDLETIEAALRIAETGHLTLATLHTMSAPQTISRIVDVFPAHQQSQVRAQVSFVLEGIVCQALLPRVGGGRVAALEVLVATPAIRNLIREDKLHQIYSTMQIGQDTGMRTLNQSLAALCRRDVITVEAALSCASNRDELRALVDRAGRAPAASGDGTGAARMGAR